jgi:MarR family transcriptional regulator, organic hydroperoxide resistance regulator
MIRFSMAIRRAPSLGATLDFLRGLWRINHAMQRMSTRMARELGLTGPQRLVVRCIGAQPGLTAGRLASLLHLDPGTVSAALGRLSRGGVVTRRSDADDRRRVELRLTRRGRALDRPAGHTIEAVVTTVLGGIPARDRATARRVLDALATALERDVERRR